MEAELAYDMVKNQEMVRYCLPYPTSYLTEDKSERWEHGTRVFVSKGAAPDKPGRMELSPSCGPRKLDELYRDDQADLAKEHPGITFSVKALRADSYALSWRQGDRIHYGKVWKAPGESDCFVRALFDYPAREQPAFGKIIQKVTSANPSCDAAAAPVFAAHRLAFLGQADAARTFWESKGAAWIEERVRRAKTKNAERVRVLLVHRGPWGCQCPEYYLGVETATNPTNLWIEPSFPPGFTEPPLESVRGGDKTSIVSAAVMAVEGVFTGDFTSRSFGEEADPARVAPFRITRVESPQAADAMPKVLPSSSGSPPPIASSR